MARKTKYSVVDDELIDWIIKEEGFLDKPTDIGDGKVTIGSGLTDPKWIDKYKKKGYWSKEDNRKAVAEELQKRSEWAEDTLPNWGSLPANTKKAMLSYKYNYDFTKENSPKLFGAMESGNFIEAVRQMDATSKNPKFKKGLQARREREQQWGLQGLFEKPVLDKSYEYPDATTLVNPYTAKIQNITFTDQYVPTSPAYNLVEADKVSAEINEYDKVRRAIDAQAAYRRLIQDNAWENQEPKRYVPTSDINYVIDSYSEGGKLDRKKLWDELSMKEKADMIRVAVKNGITTLPEIREKYNEFAMGGDTEGVQSEPTLDEYYAQRAAEEQEKYYLQGSRSRKESYPVFLSVPYTEEDEDRDRRSVDIAVKNLHRNTGIPIAEIYDRLNNGTLYGTEQFQGNNYDNSTARLIINTANRVISKKHEPVPQPNCIATATSNNPNKGHFVTGNLSFAANPGKFGFTKVNKESAKPGSLVQVVYGNTPTHAMILDNSNNGVEKFNYSPGNYPEYKTNASYPVGSRYGTHLDYYNFVGNEADSARWKKEYEEIYNKKALGGHIYDGETEESQQMETYEAPWVTEAKERGIIRRNWLEEQAAKYAQAVENAKHPTGHYMNELVVTPNGYSIGSVSSDAMLDNLLSSTRERQAKDRRDASSMVKHIHEGTDTAAKALYPLVAAPAASYLYSGITGLMANPVVDAALTVDGVINAPSRIREGIGDISNGNYGSAAWNLGTTALDILGGANLARKVTSLVKSRRVPKITSENAASITPEVNWDADNWFKTISGRNSYSAEEAAELASHVPEYRVIEQKLFDEGKLALDSNGNIVVVGSEMSPQEYIMRQSVAFQKMNPEHHYVGVSKGMRNSFENEARDPNTRNRYEVWTDRKSPKNVEEYAQSLQGGYTNDSQIETIEHQMTIREENYDLHKEQLKWKLDHGKISQENYDRDLAALEDMYNWKQKVAEDELKVLRQQKALDPLNGGKVFDVTYPKETAETPIINAENNHWTRIPFDNVVRDAPSVVTHYKQRPYSNELQTDQIVSAARRNGYGVTHIDNVMDTYDGTMLNETIIGRDTPIKSVLGNTGTFDIESPNKWKLYRSLISPFLGLGAARTLYGTK